jgi:[acyl-carrier-protein] S-malonyltransferase
MGPAAEKLLPELSRVSFRDPIPPVFTNVEAAPNASAARIVPLLHTQVTAPVRFTEIVRGLAESGVTQVLEVGPGRVLTGLVARISPRLVRRSLESLRELPDAVELVAGSG